MLKSSYACLALLVLLPITGQATTIYRCDVAGVPSFQDTPCADTVSASSQEPPRVQILKERRHRLLQRRRALMAELLELQSQAADEKATAPVPTGEADYGQQAERQRLQWNRRARLEQAQQRLAELDDNLRLLEARLARLATP